MYLGETVCFKIYKACKSSKIDFLLDAFHNLSSVQSFFKFAITDEAENIL